MRFVGLYSTARYGLYFEQYIDGYIINVVINQILKKLLQQHSNSPLTKKSHNERLVHLAELHIYMYIYL